MFEGLACSDTVIRIVDKQFDDEVLHLVACVWYQLDNARAFDRREVKLHMRCIFLEIVQQCLFGAAQDIVDFVHLVHLVVAGEQWEQRDDLEEHAAYAPKVHLVAVVAVGEEALGRPVPPGGNIFRIRLFRVNASARSKIG